MPFVMSIFNPNSQSVIIHYTKKTMQILSKETTVHSSSYSSPPIPQHLYTETSCKFFFQRNDGSLIPVIDCFDVKFQSVIELLYTKQRQKIIQILFPSK